MTTLKDARRLWQETQRKFAPQTPVRYGFLGDGRGNANSNIYVPSGSNTLLWARERVGSDRFFPVLNKDAVIPQFNLPVVIGYQPDDLRQEQVLRVHIGGLGTVATSGVALLGPHHTQHEWDGGDVVFVDGLQFKPGLAQPTSPASMSLKVLSFIYFWDKWKQFPITTTGTLTQFKPGAGKSVYVLIALDPTTDTLVYRPGLPYSTPTIASITSFDFNNVPAPAGNEFPITFVGLDSATTVLSWGSLDNSIADARLHVNAPLLNILDRLRQLEGYSGNEPSIATTGAAASTVSDQNRTLGGLTNVNTDGATDTQALVFNQATNRWIPGTAVGGGGSFTLNFNNNPILTGQATLLQGTGASLSQSGASITISATGGGAALDPSTPAGVGASPNAGNSASAAAGNHIHKGVLSILAGTGASVETSTAGCVTIGLAGSGWTSAIQLASRTTGVTYTNGSLTRFVSAVYAASTTLLAQANLQFKTGAASPPANIIGETLMAGVADAYRETLVGFVLPNEYYTVIDLSQAGASINLSKWTEYDDTGASTPASTADWTAAGETWTYVSADGPTGVFSVPSDVTGKYSVGMRVRYVQTTTKYGIITAVGAFGGGVTNITIYGGTDYTTANAAITSPFYSTVKAPFGFPLNPTKWTVVFTDTTYRTQATPVANTVYNVGALSFDVPIGVWFINAAVLVDASATTALTKFGLSTANNSFSDVSLVSAGFAGRIIETLTRPGVVNLAAKTTYYWVASCNANNTLLDYRNDLIAGTSTALCAYL